MRWAELRNSLDRKAAWKDPDIIRFVGLQGKRSIEAYFDPELNALFHAFDVLGNRIGHRFWKEGRDTMPLGNRGGFQNGVPYREVAEPPVDETAAYSLIRTVIERHVGRLAELLAEHGEIEAEDPAERLYDRAALDTSPGFERHRRYQSARTRELLRTLETLRKMRKEEFGTGNEEVGIAEGKCQKGECSEHTTEGCPGPTPHASRPTPHDGCSEPMIEGCSGSVVEDDSQHVADDATGADAHEAIQPGQGEVVGQCVRESTIQKSRFTIGVVPSETMPIWN